MIDPVTLRRLTYRVTFAVIAIAILMQKLLPLNLEPGGWPEPDILVLVAFAWVLRRPNYVPLIFVACIFLLNDLLLFRPPGLWAACAVVGLEFLRSRKNTMQGQPFLFEWIFVSAVLALMVLVNRLMLGIFFVPQQNLTSDIVFLVGNMLLYAPVVAVSVFIFRIRASVIGTDDLMDQR